MTTEFRIGSLWAGQPSRPIADLLHKLASDPLRADFDDAYLIGSMASGHVTFAGNFTHESFAFRVTTDDAALIAQLSAAIRANQRRPDYRKPRRAYVAWQRDETLKRRRSA